ncbi:MAG: AAA family ATPase, partial [Bacteroidota bacterium]
MAKLPISTKTFEHIISEGMVYVDKTAFVWKLSQEGKYYFLSRPRRFGKSLLISTLKSFFEGHKDLFKGLFIANKEKEWKKHPIIFIDYSLIEYRKGVEIFEQSLLNYIANTGQEYGIVLQQKATIAEAFTELIKRLHEQYGKVVILVDEYDKALADTLNDKVKFKDNREVLRGLYGVMKGLDDYLRFVMLTGVSRFAKVSVFSGMNNLKDISLSEEFNEIVGFTQKELEHYFSDYLKQVQEKFGTTSPTLKESIRKKYNGFSWDGKNKLYNPYSILNFLTDKAFRNYWFSSGTPNFLVNLIKEQQQLPEKLENIKVTDLEGNTTQIEKLPLLPILFQTGYLTIQQIEYDGFDERFLLNYPNEEVRESFIRYVVASFVGKNEFELQ